MPSPTTNFSWQLPTVGADTNVWGGYLNSNLIAQDSLIRALANTNIGPMAPMIPIPQNGTHWINSTTNPWVWSVFNAGSSTWIPIGNIDTMANTFTPSNGTSGFFIGDYKISAQTANHGNWLVCDGSAISRTTYSALYTLFLGLTPTLPFGPGDGSTTFNLPDLRGVIAGSVGINGIPANPALPWNPPTRVVGQFIGEEKHQLISTELPDPITQLAGVANFTITGGVNGIQSTTNGGLGGQSGIISNNGGNQPHNTMQPTVFAGSYFIYVGV